VDVDDYRITCGAPGPEGTVCDLPPHEGAIHAFSVELPAHLGVMVAEYLTQLEQAKENYETAEKWTRRAKWFMYVATAVNIFAAIVNIGGIVS
jgi:hypothetical protein